MNIKNSYDVNCPLLLIFLAIYEFLHRANEIWHSDCGLLYATSIQNQKECNNQKIAEIVVYICIAFLIGVFKSTCCLENDECGEIVSWVTYTSSGSFILILLGLFDAFKYFFQLYGSNSGVILPWIFGHGAGTATKIIEFILGIMFVLISFAIRIRISMHRFRNRRYQEEFDAGYRGLKETV